jgi:hypothetical protein
MKIYAVLTIGYDDDYENTSDSYDVNAFKSDKKRLTYLCTHWFENNLGFYIQDQYNNEEDIKQLKEDNLLIIELNDEERIESIKINTEKYSYETLNTLKEKYGEGHYVSYKYDYELYEIEL